MARHVDTRRIEKCSIYFYVVYVELVSLECIASVLVMQGDGATMSHRMVPCMEADSWPICR